MNRPLVLIIRDGWGIGPHYAGNAVTQAKTPNMSRLAAEYPRCVLDCAGEEVGVRAGSQGSSEVGHLNMGAGRVVEQEVLRVDKAIASGDLWKTPGLVQAVEDCKSNGTKLHLMCLVQDQGVHATEDHLYSFLEFATREGLTDVCVHFFGDGRDTPPRSALVYLDRLEKKIAEYGVGRVASVIGRYYAMDRGENWELTKVAYDALVHGTGLTAASARAAIEEAYARADAQIARGDADEEHRPESDEFIRPTLIAGDDGAPVGLIEPGDVVIHLNYRQDRAIQLTRAFIEDDFTEFDRGPLPDVTYMGLTRYYDEFPYALVAPMNMSNLLSEVLGRNGLRQLRISEYQKFRHCTSFFNGKVIEPFPMEDRVQVESISIPENEQPEMSARPVTELVVTAVEQGISALRAAAEVRSDTAVEFDAATASDPGRLDETYDVIVLNFANCDMVGHTGVLEAGIKAVETVDECVGKVVDAVLKRDGIALVTADHGNAEQMIGADGSAQTAHSTSDVEFILASNDAGGYELRERGILADVALTMLDLLNIDPPPEMTAHTLIKH
jgi:2,3-bisphosphoglycerate-independent phosphoglycerate mutase